MKIQAELSLYPLRIRSYEKTIEAFIEDLSQSGITVIPGAMSTMIAGEEDAVFQCISECYHRAACSGDVVLKATFSNACPVLKDHKNTD